MLWVGVFLSLFSSLAYSNTYGNHGNGCRKMFRSPPIWQSPVEKRPTNYLDDLIQSTGMKQEAENILLKLKTTTFNDFLNKQLLHRKLHQILTERQNIADRMSQELHYTDPKDTIRVGTNHK